MKKVAEKFGGCELCAYLYGMSNTKQHMMNKVTNLTKRFSFEYMYRVDGCVFTLEQCSISKMWHLTGYTSREALDAYETPFLQESMELKRHATHFLKFTFKRENWFTETYMDC